MNFPGRRIFVLAIIPRICTFFLCARLALSLYVVFETFFWCRQVKNIHGCKKRIDAFMLGTEQQDSSYLLPEIGKRHQLSCFLTMPPCPRASMFSVNLVGWRQRGSVSRGCRGVVHRCGSLHVRSPQGMRGATVLLVDLAHLLLAFFRFVRLALDWIAFSSWLSQFKRL